MRIAVAGGVAFFTEPVGTKCFCLMPAALRQNNDPKHQFRWAIVLEDLNPVAYCRVNRVLAGFYETREQAMAAMSHGFDCPAYDHDAEVRQFFDQLHAGQLATFL